MPVFQSEDVDGMRVSGVYDGRSQCNLEEAGSMILTGALISALFPNPNILECRLRGYHTASTLFKIYLARGATGDISG